MEFSVNEQEKGIVIQLIGRLDATTAPQFEQDVDTYLASPANNLVLDFAELDYISSAGLRVILKIAKAYKPASFEFTVCQIQDHVREVFEMSGFEHFITVRNTVEECLG